MNISSKDDILENSGNLIAIKTVKKVGNPAKNMSFEGKVTYSVLQKNCKPLDNTKWQSAPVAETKIIAKLQDLCQSKSISFS